MIPYRVRPGKHEAEAVVVGRADEQACVDAADDGGGGSLRAVENELVGVRLPPLGPELDREGRESRRVFDLDTQRSLSPEGDRRHRVIGRHEEGDLPFVLADRHRSIVVAANEHQLTHQVAVEVADQHVTDVGGSALDDAEILGSGLGEAEAMRGEARPTAVELQGIVDRSSVEGDDVLVLTREESHDRGRCVARATPDDDSR